jgi:hypothetical protein
VRLIAVLFLAMIAPAAASEVAGTAQIVDADTVYIGRTKIRLQGVDAPEMDQACLDGNLGGAESMRVRHWRYIRPVDPGDAKSPGSIDTAVTWRLVS